MPSNTVAKSYVFDLDHKEFVVKISSQGQLQLYVDDCLRKCDASNAPVLYVWTNVEMFWEEHRYVEARYNRSTDQLRVTVNRVAVSHREVI